MTLALTQRPTSYLYTASKDLCTSKFKVQVHPKQSSMKTTRSMVELCLKSIPTVFDCYVKHEALSKVSETLKSKEEATVSQRFSIPLCQVLKIRESVTPNDET